LKSNDNHRFGWLKAGHFYVAYVANNSRLFSMPSVYCRQLRATYMRHNMADDPIYRKPTRRLRSFAEAEWARLPPAVRAAYNNLRRQRCLPPIPEPAIDLSPKPFKPSPKLLDPSPLAREIVRGGDLEQEQVFFEELKVATDALLTAHDGNPRALAERLRRGMATPEECRLAADLIEDKTWRFSHRPPTWNKDLRLDVAGSLLRAWYYAEPDQRGSQNKVIRVCVRAYHITRDDAFRLLKKIRAEAVEHAEQGDGYRSSPVDAATAARAPEGFLRRTTKS
jgi:hypothetical protein